MQLYNIRDLQNNKNYTIHNSWFEDTINNKKIYYYYIKYFKPYNYLDFKPNVLKNNYYAYNSFCLLSEHKLYDQLNNLLIILYILDSCNIFSDYNELNSLCNLMLENILFHCDDTVNDFNNLNLSNLNFYKSSFVVPQNTLREYESSLLYKVIITLNLFTKNTNNEINKCTFKSCFSINNNNKYLTYVSMFNINKVLCSINYSIILNIIQCILLEKKIIIVSNNNDYLTSAINTILSLISPLKWNNIVFTSIPYSHLSIIKAPVSYIIGISNINLLYNTIVDIIHSGNTHNVEFKHYINLFNNCLLDSKYNIKLTDYSDLLYLNFNNQEMLIADIDNNTIGFINMFNKNIITSNCNVFIDTETTKDQDIINKLKNLVFNNNTNFSEISKFNNKSNIIKDININILNNIEHNQILINIDNNKNNTYKFSTNDKEFVIMYSNIILEYIISLTSICNIIKKYKFDCNKISNYYFKHNNKLNKKYDKNMNSNYFVNCLMNSKFIKTKFIRYFINNKNSLNYIVNFVKENLNSLYGIKGIQIDNYIYNSNIQDDKDNDNNYSKYKYKEIVFNFKELEDLDLSEILLYKTTNNNSNEKTYENTKSINNCFENNNKFDNTKNIFFSNILIFVEQNNNNNNNNNNINNITKEDLNCTTDTKKNKSTNSCLTLEDYIYYSYLNNLELWFSISLDFLRFFVVLSSKSFNIEIDFKLLTSFYLNIVNSIISAMHMAQSKLNNIKIKYYNDNNEILYKKYKFSEQFIVVLIELTKHLKIYSKTLEDKTKKFSEDNKIYNNYKLLIQENFNNCNVYFLNNNPSKEICDYISDLLLNINTLISNFIVYYGSCSHCLSNINDKNNNKINDFNYINLLIYGYKNDLNKLQDLNDSFEYINSCYCNNCNKYFTPFLFNLKLDENNNYINNSINIEHIKVIDNYYTIINSYFYYDFVINTKFNNDLDNSSKKEFILLKLLSNKMYVINYIYICKLLGYPELLSFLSNIILISKINKTFINNNNKIDYECKSRITNYIMNCKNIKDNSYIAINEKFYSKSNFILSNITNQLFTIKEDILNNQIGNIIKDHFIFSNSNLIYKLPSTIIYKSIELLCSLNKSKLNNDDNLSNINQILKDKQFYKKYESILKQLLN